jgi:hypothetical protein
VLKAGCLGYEMCAHTRALHLSPCIQPQQELLCDCFPYCVCAVLAQLLWPGPYFDLTVATLTFGGFLSGLVKVAMATSCCCKT